MAEKIKSASWNYYFIIDSVTMITLLTNKSVTCSLQMMNQETSSGCSYSGLCQKVMLKALWNIKRCNMLANE